MTAVHCSNCGNQLGILTSKAWRLVFNGCVEEVPRARFVACLCGACGHYCTADELLATIETPAA